MEENIFSIDIERLRADMRNELLSSFFGGGLGGALIESFDIDKASDEELVEIALKKGISLIDYQV